MLVVVNSNRRECKRLLPTNSTTKSVRCRSSQLLLLLLAKISIQLTRAYQVWPFYQAKRLRVQATTPLVVLSVESHNSRLLKWQLDKKWVHLTKRETSEFPRKDCWWRRRQIISAVEITRMGLETLLRLFGIDSQLKAFQKHKWAKTLRQLMVATIY